MRTTLPEPDPRSPTPDRLRRAFSLSGVVPLGVFLVVHAVANVSAVVGSWAFARVGRALQDLPALPLLEVLIVFAPLAFHGALGAWIVATRRPFASSYPRPLRVAMRVTAIATLAFLAVHLPQIRFRSPGARLGPGALATALDATLSSTSHGVPWAALLYLVGGACATFHLACGAWGYFAATPAGLRDARLRKQVAWAAVAGGAVMWVMFADAVVLRATGSAPIGAPSEGPPTEPCPSP